MSPMNITKWAMKRSATNMLLSLDILAKKSARISVFQAQSLSTAR